MRSRFKNNLYRMQSFWQLRSHLDRSVGFGFWRQLFKLRSGFQKEKISARLLWASLPSVLVSILCAILFVLSVEVFNQLTQLKFPFEVKRDALTVLLSAIVTVCGVFLGLYFTAVSAVAGNLFMRATEDLQALFIREKQCQQYVKTLVLTTVVGILYLLLNVFGFQLSPFGPILVAFLAGYAVIRFMSLGSQVFYFLHPIQASSTITSDAARAIISATAKGFCWKKPAFQNHYKKQADQTLDTMRNLIDFAIDVIKLSDQQLVTMARYISSLLRYYMERKKSIPSESLWYKSKYQFPNWILADSTQIMLALNTGTSLTPKDIK